MFHGWVKESDFHTNHIYVKTLEHFFFNFVTLICETFITFHVKKGNTKGSATYIWQIDNEKSKSRTVQKYKRFDESHGFYIFFYKYHQDSQGHPVFNLDLI